MDQKAHKERKKHRLVMGLGSGWIYGMGKGGKWKELLPKHIEQFDNDFLISVKDISYSCMEFLKTICDPSDRMYVDSGGFSLYKDEKKYGKDNPIFQKNCVAMRRKYLKSLELLKPKVTFELDNEFFRYDDDIMSPKNYCREEVKAILGHYPVPVFKMHQGFQYWQQLCESDEYDILSIGGLAQTREWHVYRDEIKIMMDYARAHNKKVHLLGCQNIETFKMVQPDTVDYNIFQLCINLREAHEEHPEIGPEHGFNAISRHAILWALARAKVRTFFYDSYQVSNEE